MKKLGLVVVHAVLLGAVSAQSSGFGHLRVIAANSPGFDSTFTADLDGDGDVDVLVASFAQSAIAWHSNDGLGNFGPRREISAGAIGVRCVFAADVDGDGGLDIISASESPTLSDNKICWYKNLGGGSFGGQQVISTSHFQPRCVSGADIDADGDVDLLVVSPYELSYYENQGGATFAARQLLPSASGAYGERSVCTRDIDGDGHADIIAASARGVAWRQGLGGGAFGSENILAASARSFNVYAEDIDGDGDADILATFDSDAPGQVSWYENLGGGAFGSRRPIRTDPRSGLIDFVSASTADVDGDGDQDVLTSIWSPSAPSETVWYENLGGGVFGPKQLIAASGGKSLCSADLDIDGDADIVVSYAGVGWYQNQRVPRGPHMSVAVRTLFTVAAPIVSGGIAMAGLPRGGALLLAGQSSGGGAALTVEINRDAWNIQASALNPVTRTGHTLALDRAGQNNVMFGGADLTGIKLSDTWVYASGQWSNLSPLSSPSARAEHAMVGGSSRNRILLLGGEDTSGTCMADMWSWDGTDWTQLFPGTLPPARRGHGMAYDELRDRVVLFGGSDGTVLLRDVWEWDGSDWMEVTPALGSNGAYWGPDARESFAMAYDARGERVLVHGGETDTGCVGDLWSWDGVTWTLHVPSGSAPTARKGQAMFYDPAASEMRLFGGDCGIALFHELWKFDLPIFHRFSTFGVGCAGTVGVPTLAPRAGTRPVLGDSFIGELTNIPSFPGSVVFGLLGLSKDRLGGAALPLDLAVIGMPGCSLLTSANETMTLPNLGGQAVVPLPVTTSLLGYTLYLQCAVLDRWANALGIVMSNGLEFRIGNR